MRSTGLRVFAALGPGDIVQAHRKQLNGDVSGLGPSLVFSGQLAEYCRARGFAMLGVSHHPRADKIIDGSIELRNVPMRSAGRIALARRGLELLGMAHRFHADVALIDSGSASPFALIPFRIAEIPIAINFHNVLWATGQPPRRFRSRLRRGLDRQFFSHVAAGALGCTAEIGRQLAASGGGRVPFFEWRAQYRPQQVSPGMRPQIPPFRIGYVGRVEASKGVFDLIEIARLVVGDHRIDAVVEVCGDGGALEDLKSRVSEAGLADRFIFHGWVDRPGVLAFYGRIHSIIVPTGGGTGEGMPMVCAEAAIYGLPIVTSAISNAKPILGNAVFEVEAENPAAYAAALATIAADRCLAAAMGSEGRERARCFFDRTQSYPAAVDRLLARLFPEKIKPLEDYEPIFERVC